MTKTILSCPIYDIEITESPDYLGRPSYLLRYGLETDIYDTLSKAIKDFNNDLDHARIANGDQT